MIGRGEDGDPLSVVVNLFDVAMVFAVSLMVAMVMHINMTEIFGKEDFSIVKNPGKDNMEIITKEGNKINKYTPSKIKQNPDPRVEKLALLTNWRMVKLSTCQRSKPSPFTQ